MPRRRELEIGLQAANKIVNLQTQTYYNRSVNKSTIYEASDFMDELKAQTANEQGITQKLDKFIDRVAYRIEEALQQNEIINVFQSDFDMLGDEEAAAGAKGGSINKLPRAFFDQTYCKNKRVTCIKFHPQKMHWVAMSVVENLTFEERTSVSGRSYDSHVLILNFSDSQVIVPQFFLHTLVEITAIEFAPENPKQLIGGCINGQLIAWDLGSNEHRITEGRKASGE